jgi:hypothetical protein
MRTTDLSDLLKAVESIRSEMHPDLSRSFLEAVVAAEEANPEDDDGAMKAIEAALNAALRSDGGA